MSDHASDAQAIVMAEITRIPGPKKKTATGYSIRCPFHNDNNPSCSVNTTPNLRHKGKTVGMGHFYCFSCEEGRGPWNKLAEKLGLRKIGEGENQVTTFVHRQLDENVFKSESISISDLMEAWKCEEWSELHREDEWRSFTGKFLRKFGALKTMNERGDHLLVLPVYVGEEIVGGIKARWIKKEGQLSYINSKGAWTKDAGLWPYDYVMKMKPRCVWLVEGPRDAMRLLRYGIPALCILGTQNWSEAKRDLIIALGVERIVSFMDGDVAGRTATKLIRPTFDSLLECKAVNMWHLTKRLGLKKLDPFEVPKKHLSRYVKRYHLAT